MKNLATVLGLLSALALLDSCTGVKQTGNSPASTPTSSAQIVGGNWEFTPDSTPSGTPLKIAGSLNQSGKKISGVVHVEGSACFDPLTIIAITGVVTGGNITLTSTSVAGEVATLTGAITSSSFSGNYTLNGGCGSGAQGHVTGMSVPTLTNSFDGTFTTSGQQTFAAALQVTQGNASPEGSFGITGTAAFNIPCFTSGTIKSGTYPSASYILGTRVALEIETNNGTMSFVGTEDPVTGQINGTYTVSGGTCDDAGTANLLGSNPWDY